MTQGQFLSRVYQVWIQSFPSSRLVAISRLKISVYPSWRGNSRIHNFPKSISAMLIRVCMYVCMCVCVIKIESWKCCHLIVGDERNGRISFYKCPLWIVFEIRWLKLKVQNFSSLTSVEITSKHPRLSNTSIHPLWRMLVQFLCFKWII